jgi:hypothetical protein
MLAQLHTKCIFLIDLLTYPYQKNFQKMFIVVEIFIFFIKLVLTEATE